MATLAVHLPEWRNGRRGGLKILCWQQRVGSSPTSGTTCRTSIRQVHDHQIPVETATVDSETALGDNDVGNDDPCEKSLFAHRVDAHEAPLKNVANIFLNARAHERSVRTVSEMTPHHGLGQHKQIQSTLSSLGRLATPANDPAPGRTQRSLTLVHSRAPQSDAAFPCGATPRTIDDDGRIKPSLRAGSLASLCDWQSGVLDTVIVDGYLKLTQRSEHIGAPRGRSSGHVGFSVNAKGLERVLLRPAHLQQLGLVPGDAVILAVVPEHRALVVINPCLLAGFAPAHVRAMLISGDDALTPVVSRALSSVVAGAQ